MDVLYEDNHLIIVNKRAGEIVQGDKTGDEPLVETVKQYIKEAYAKPGNRGDIHKTYWAIVERNQCPPQATLVHWLKRNELQNKSYAYDREVPDSKHAELDYRVLAEGDRYILLEVNLKTGRHHQIRCQLAKVGLPIRGDLKYGARRSNPDGSISLMARSIDFEHPVTHQPVHIEAPLPDDVLWDKLFQCVK